MTKQTTNLQPDHYGKHPKVAINPGMVVSHMSHGLGPHVTGHAGNSIATNGSPKKLDVVPYHGAHVARALDDGSGAAVIPGTPKSSPGWSSTPDNGNPLARPPGGKKNLARVAPTFGSKKVSDDLHELGSAVLAAAFAASHSGDRQAHGRKPDGTK